MRVRFLADENLDQDIVWGILRRQPNVDFELPLGVLSKGMPDPVLLEVAAALNRVLVTHDVRTMPHHFGEFIQAQTCPGIILVPKSMAIGLVIEELLVIWEASTVDDWVNLIQRLPI